MTGPINMSGGKSVVIGLRQQGETVAASARSRRELIKLLDTLGYQTVAEFYQNRTAPRAATILGTGKLEQVMGFLAANPDVTCVAFDGEISPTQQRNLEDLFQVTLLDRTTVILEIFNRRARTREAKLQVELARLNYLSPRLRSSHNLDRQAGGIGLKGIGETKHELDKRRIRDRIAQLRRKLKEIQKSQQLRRKRQAQERKVVLFGYTNAGKSSLMRALTGESVYVEDKLFATLDTKTRAVRDFPRILMVDTVGIIQKLPHSLVASFHATLAEAQEADLLLHVVDASDPDWPEQVEAGRKLLDELETENIPYQIVFNKIDLVPQAERRRLRMRYPQAILATCKEKESLQGLMRLVMEAVL